MHTIVAEGPEFWSRNSKEQNQLSRVEILFKMNETIMKWPVNRKRNINYRSLVPIIKLLDVDIDMQAQYWAVWALTNLTRVSPGKYCPMLAETGLEELKKLLFQPNINKDLKNLCEVCLYQVELFELEGHLRGLETCKSIKLEFIRNYASEAVELSSDESI